MAAAGERLRVQLRGIRGAEVRSAVLALNGASRIELQRATALGALLSDRCLLVAVDGGWNTCRRGHRRPDLFVGDGDSASRLPASIPSVTYDPDKDFSDLAGALRELKARRVQVVVIAGLLGGRLDHEWANVQELGARARWFAGILAPTDRATILITSRGCRAATVRDRTVSLFPLGAAAQVTLRGTRWTLRRRALKAGSLGLSNVTGKALDLTVHSGVVAVVLPLPARKRKP